MQIKIILAKLKALWAVGSGVLLGRRRIGIKTMNDPAGERHSVALGAINDPCAELTEMLNYPGPVAVLVEALKREGVRFDESCFPNENITYQNPNVAIIRGEAAEFLHRACKSIESRRAGEQPRHSNLRVGSSPQATTGILLCLMNGRHALSHTLRKIRRIIHKRSRPNEKS